MKKRNEQHSAYLHEMPCCIPGCHTRPVHAAHIKYSDAAYNKYNTLGKKPRGPNGEEWFTVPLCEHHHLYVQHRMSERKFWDDAGIDPHVLGKQLWNCSESGDVFAGERIIRKWGW